MAPRTRRAGPVADGRSRGGASWVRGQLQRLLDPADQACATSVAALLCLCEAVLCGLIIWRVKYTEIDWEAYMDEVGGFLAGERDYHKLQGSTGPLVYPAGFVYVYSGLKHLTGGSVAAAQPVFAALYVATLAVVLAVYIRARALPPVALPLLCLSKRLHSLYVLRLFNDCVAMLPAFGMVALAQRGHWLAASVAWSAAVSVKMNALLFAPALALLMLQACTTDTIFAGAALAIALQVVLGAPFLAVHPAQYLGRAFEFGRQFQQQWSVNLQFLPPAVFASSNTALLLLALHLALLAGFAHTRWLRREGGLMWLLKSSLRRLTRAPTALRALTPEHVATVMFEANFVGIVAARSLHFQFYSWYAFTLPYMVWKTRLPGALKLVLLGGIEACWNVYPPTAATSVALAACHLALVAALLAARMDDGTKRVKRRGGACGCSCRRRARSCPAPPVSATAAGVQPQSAGLHWSWDPLGLGASPGRGGDAGVAALTVLSLQGGGPRARPSPGGSGGVLADFWNSKLPGKLATLAALLVVSRVGVYIPLEGVDRAAFAAQVQSSGLLGYVDTLAGGSISKVGVFSLGIVPYINSSIIFQLLASALPWLQKLQKEEGEAGRRQFAQYQRYGALAFGAVQAVGQCLYLRPFVEDFSPAWLATSSLSLTAGAMVLVWLSEALTELKLGNGTSLLIFVNILSALPLSAGQTLVQASAAGNNAGLAAFALAFLVITAGIVGVQEAERRIPISMASRFNAQGGLARASYLPFKVNGAGVMPIIFASSLLALPSTLARLGGGAQLEGLATALGPGGGAYLPVNVALIAFFNYFYTFLQLEPRDVADSLKKQGASIPGVRPGLATSDYISGVLERLSLLGSVFLGALAAAPALVEATTGLTTFRGFGGTSILILVGVATDSARKVASELVMTKYDAQLDESLYGGKPPQ